MRTSPQIQWIFGIALVTLRILHLTEQQWLLPCWSIFSYAPMTE
jgi:hypothetical protein